MNNQLLRSLLSWRNGKIFVLSWLVKVSFYLSSIGWRHVESTEQQRVLVAALILLVLYALIVFELLNRNLAALVGAAMSVAAHDCLVEFATMEQLLGWLDLETLALLFGMMIIVSVLGGSGLFDYLAVWTYKKAAGRFWLLISIMSLITACLSALVDNVSTMLLMTPTLVRLSELEHIDPRYVLMVMVIVCNIGGCATPVGDPPNLIIIGNDLVAQIGISFGSFTGYCAPGVLLTLLCLLAYLRLRYKSKESFRLVEPPRSEPTEQRPSRGDLLQELEALQVAEDKLDSLSGPTSRETRQLRARLEEQTAQLRAALGDLPPPPPPEGQTSSGERTDCEQARKSSRLDEQEIERLMQRHRIKDFRTLWESLAVLGATILLFFLQAIPGLNLTLGWASLFAGLTLLVLNSRKGDQSFEQTIAQIEWTTLMFFFALFITMEAMAKLGLIGFLGSQVSALIEQLPAGRVREMGAISVVLWASGLASACIDNVPFTSMMVKILATMIGGAGAGASAGVPLRALVFALSFGACYGGNGTLIGASANLVTAGLASRLGYPITFNGFFKFAAPITLLSLLVANLYLIVVFVLLGL